MPAHPASEAIAADFTSCVRRAVCHELSAIEVIAAAERMGQQGEATLVKQLYRLWLDNNPDDPFLHAVSFNYGVLLNETGEAERAQAAFGEAIRVRPDFMPAYINLGSLLERHGRPDQAVSTWLQVVERLAPVTGETILHKTTALKQIGRVLERALDSANAEEALQKCLDADPTQRDAIQHWIALRQTQCKWPVLAPWGTLTKRQLLQAISPLSIAVYTDDPLFQLANAHRYYRQDVAANARLRTIGAWPAPDAPRTRPLRIGYLSSDLREHAVGFLTAEIYGLHDRSRVEIFAYYCGIPSSDMTQARIRGSVDHWRDITALDDRTAARQMVEDGIDILVDLNGYTKDARLALIAMRPAPIIVNWLGFPGSTGTPHHHYIIADEQVVPPGAEHYYAETVVRLPCYQPNDRHRVIAEERPTRQAMGLPEDAFVYCCFNGTQKITRHCFARWMTILRATPHAVLWLLSGGDSTDERLRQLAAGHGVSPERLVFAGRMANPQHLARYGLADLFLDTAPYGAHTTASDALWMGLPVLTTAGRGFASRVCASLVHAAGLPELVADSFEAYVVRAVELARHPERLQQLQERLRAGRDRCVLFDTPLLVRRLEDLFEDMWTAYAEDRLPRPDLANLDLYHEIGSELDDENVELQGRADYEARYQTALAYRPELPIGSARRLNGAGRA